MLKEDLVANPQHTYKLPMFPTRHIKLIINHKGRDFCEERRVLLDNYVKKLLATKELARKTNVIGFLSHSDESLSKEKISADEIAAYEKSKIESIIRATKED